jgi:hypothetical protein
VAAAVDAGGVDGAGAGVGLLHATIVRLATIVTRGRTLSRSPHEVYHPVTSLGTGLPPAGLPAGLVPDPRGRGRRGCRAGSAHGDHRQRWMVIAENGASPGPVRTALLEKFLSTEEKRQRRLVHIPMGRFGEAREM